MNLQSISLQKQKVCFISFRLFPFPGIENTYEVNTSLFPETAIDSLRERKDYFFNNFLY